MTPLSATLKNGNKVFLYPPEREWKVYEDEDGFLCLVDNSGYLLHMMVQIVGQLDKEAKS